MAPDTEIERLRADNARFLRGIRGALDYLNKGRIGDASFNLEALLAGSQHEACRHPNTLLTATSDSDHYVWSCPDCGDGGRGEWADRVSQ